MTGPGTNGKPVDPTIEAEVDRLVTMPIAQWRVRYREVFRTEPPKAFGPDLLRRSIAYRIQEKAYGGLSRPTQRLLDQMVKAYAAKPNGRLELPRRIKPGSILVRQWKGKGYCVTVMAEGFAYDGNTYPSLSEIASLITGTRWNGPRFFGLRPTGRAEEGSAPAVKRNTEPKPSPRAPKNARKLRTRQSEDEGTASASHPPRKAGDRNGR
jgi:hypothetical protein